MINFIKDFIWIILSLFLKTFIIFYFSKFHKITPNLILKPEVKVIQRNNSTRDLYGGNFASLMARTGRDTSITNCRKAPNPKVYNSFNVGDIGNESMAPYKRETKYK